MRFTISEIANRSHSLEFDTTVHPESSALSVGRSSGAVFSLKQAPWVNATVGRTHFSLLKTHAGWTAVASSERHQLLQEGKALDRIELFPGCQFQFGNCLFHVQDMGNKASAQKSDYVIRITENGISREINLPLVASISIGREGSGNDIELSTKYCSRQHAIIQVNNGSFVLNDLSTNGTIIDKKTVKKSAVAIQPGQKIIIDSSTLEIINKAPQKNNSKIFILSAFLVVSVAIIAALYVTKLSPNKNGSEKPGINREEDLSEILGQKLDVFMQINGYSIADVNNLSSDNYAALRTDAKKWRSITDECEHKCERECERLIALVDQFQKLVFQQWPNVPECGSFQESIAIGFSNFSSSLASIKNSEKQFDHFNSLYKQQHSRFEQITQCWYDLCKAEEYYTKKQVNEFIEIMLELTKKGSLLPHESSAYADLQAAKIDLQCDSIFREIADLFNKEDGPLPVEKILNMVKEAESFITTLKPTGNIYKTHKNRAESIQNYCDLYRQLIKCDFENLSPDTVKNFNLFKDKALASNILYLENLAKVKINECLASFGQFIASHSQSSESYRWQTVNTIKKALEALQYLTVNIEGTGVRRQRLDTELRSLCANVKSELHKKLSLLHDQYKRSKDPEQKAAILAEMLPYAEPNGRWETWIRKEEQLLRARQ
ncbi:MAG: FHA domain-containing protein [Lentisphaeria bacterium]|jgi:hypothetical protein